tara:strand:+ start:7834 stop:9336 length:1503 start_codon:yes stop_codon:yes gene_type:complete
MHDVVQDIPLDRPAPTDVLTSSAGKPEKKKFYPKSAGSRLVVLVSAGDIVVVASALCFAWWLRFHTSLSQFGEAADVVPTLGNYLGQIVLGTSVMALALCHRGAYEHQKLLSSAHELNVVVSSTLAWLGVFLALSLILKIQPSISRVYCVVSALLMIGGLTYWRLVFTHYIVPSKVASLRKRTLLIGWTPSVQQIVNVVRTDRTSELEIVGVLLAEGMDSSAELPSEVVVLGNYKGLESVIGEHSVDNVLVGDLDLSREELAGIAELCEREMVDFELIPNCFPALLSGLSVKSVHGVPVLGVTRLPLHSGFNTYLKRVVDIIGAFVGLILAAPLIALFGILVYRESKGDIFYRQKRLGFGGKPFEMIKLRTMRLDAENGNGPGWTVKDDPRCLKIGKLMRSWNIDELPQFWNVLKGEMSLIGPRPERPELIARFKSQIPHYNARHNIKPGLTGWAQVNGLRGDTDLSERIRYDLHYIENWNLFLDFYILIKTVLTRKGAC